MIQRQTRLFVEASPASLSALQEKEKVRRMTATSGRKCLEQFGKFALNGSWAKTFAALLIGMEGWYSSRCLLTWRLATTKSYHFYFQLAASTPHTGGSEYLLLPTPAANDFKSTNQELYQTQTGTIRAHHKNKGSSRVGLEQLAKTKLLPTPTSSNRQNGTTMESKLLPTPRASEWKGVGPLGSKSQDHQLKHQYLGATLQELTGTSFQLNSLFVREMMDFPVNYLELPFLSGDKNP